MLAMLHGNDDFITFPDKLPSVTVHHQVDALGSAPDEDAFTRLERVNESLHLFARALVRSRCLLAQVVDATVNVGMLLLDIGATAINDDLRCL